MRGTLTKTKRVRHDGIGGPQSVQSGTVRRPAIVADGSHFATKTAACLARRAKAIRYSGARLEWQDVVDSDGGNESGVSRLDVEIAQRTATGLLRVRLKVWDDRWVRVDAGFLQKHRWVWECAFEGRFLAKEGARDLVRKIEETRSIGGSEDPTVSLEIGRLWKSNLAKGPTRL